MEYKSYSNATYPSPKEDATKILEKGFHYQEMNSM